jgi:hypothetical protein
MITSQQNMDISINYLELAFIMNAERSFCKQLFLNYLGTDKVSTSEEIPVKTLKKAFKNIISLDRRYDGQNELIFNLQHKSELYRKELSSKVVIKHGRFTTGKTIFYKILNPKQLEHAETIIKQRHAAHKSLAKA